MAQCRFAYGAQPLPTDTHTEKTEAQKQQLAHLKSPGRTLVLGTFAVVVVG